MFAFKLEADFPVTHGGISECGQFLFLAGTGG